MPKDKLELVNEYTGYWHDRANKPPKDGETFPSVLDRFKGLHCVIVQETCKDGSFHWHYWVKDWRTESGFRNYITGKKQCDLNPNRGAKAYSLKRCDPSRRDEFYRYLMKGDGKDSKPVVVMNVPRIDTDAYHQAFYLPENAGVSKGTKKAPSFSFTLCEIFQEKYLGQYQNKYLIDHSGRYSETQLKERRYKFLAGVVIDTLDAHTKILDQFIVKRFVLLLENRFNHEAFRRDAAASVALDCLSFC